MLLDIESHPAWVCGLKQRYANLQPKKGRVTPCVGVWIETEGELKKARIAIRASHPAWVCGLKQRGAFREHAVAGSHPAWVCGLKPYNS